MATKKSFSEKDSEAKKDLVPVKEKVAVPAKMAAPVQKKEEKKPEPLVSFARWFASKKFKPHWAAGMQTYTDTSIRRTMTEWDRLFKAY